MLSDDFKQCSSSKLCITQPYGDDVIWVLLILKLYTSLQGWSPKLLNTQAPARISPDPEISLCHRSSSAQRPPCAMHVSASVQVTYACESASQQGSEHDSSRAHSRSSDAMSLPVSKIVLQSVNEQVKE